MASVDPTKWQLMTTHVRAGNEIVPPKGEGWKLMETHAVPVRWSDGDHYMPSTTHGAHVVCIWARPRDQGAT